MSDQSNNRQRRQILNAYLVTNLVTGDRYVGIVRNREVYARWGAHLSVARNGHGYALHKDIRKWGENVFECVHVACALSRTDLNDVERLLIEQYDCYWPKGYNRTRGGSRTFAVGNPITFENRLYGSLSELAAAHGLNAQYVHQRMKKYKWTLRQALELDPRPPQPSPAAKAISVGGKTYPSRRAAAVAYGIDENHARTRMHKYGWTPDEAFGVVKHEWRHWAQVSISIAGVTYDSIKQAAEQHGVEYRVFYMRLRRGWTLEQAAGLEPSPKRVSYKAKGVIVDGRAFASVTDAIRSFPHLNKGTVCGRLQRGWTIEQALELAPPPGIKPHNPNSKEITVRGCKFSSIRKAAHEYGLSYKLVHKWLSKWGWSVEQAFGVEPPPRRVHSVEDREKGVRIGNSRYNNVSHACEELGIPFPRVWGRLTRGWTLDEAFGIVYRKPATRSA